jgi:hypothetical protein
MWNDVSDIGNSIVLIRLELPSDNQAIGILSLEAREQSSVALRTSSRKRRNIMCDRRGGTLVKNLQLDVSQNTACPASGDENS